MDRRAFLKLAGGSAVASAAGIRPCHGGQAAESAGGQGFDVAAAQRTLADHRIARIETRQFQDSFPRSVGPNAKGNPAGSGGGFPVRIITTDQGASGWSSSRGGGEEDDAKLVGMKISELFDVSTGITEASPWWLDRVLHDLAASILRMPVWRMIGAAGPRAVPIYSGAIYMEDVMPPEAPRGIPAVLAACKQDYDAGYRAFKLKIGRGFKRMPKPEGLRRDIEVVRAVRDKFPDSKVLVDANDSYTADEMVGFVKAVADCDLYWIEEPFEENRDDLKRLREAMAQAGCKALLADGEARRDRADPPTAYGGYTQAFADRLYALAAENLIDIFVLDLDIVGFSRWRRAMPKLAKAGVRAAPHAWMWTVRSYYSAQLAAGAGNVAIVEGIPGGAPGIDYSAYRMEGGNLVVPDVPGFGLRLR